MPPTTRRRAWPWTRCLARRGAWRRACARLCLLLAACHAAPHPAPLRTAGVTPHSPALANLRRNLDALLAAPELEHSTWGVLVKSLATDETLYGLNAGKLLMPASNVKIITLAAAADRLGWNYRYETRLLARPSCAAPPCGSTRTDLPALRDVLDDEGILHGDLVVVGSGDPSIGGRDAPDVFDSWAAQLKTLGIRRIEGGIVGDDRAFAAPTAGAGWAWDDLGEGYAAAFGALQFHENAVRATVAPGRAAGDAAVVTLEPGGSGLMVRNEVVTASEGPPAIRSRRRPGSPEIELQGSVPLSGPSAGHTVAIDQPTRFFVTMLRHALIEHGIDVRGKALGIGEAGDRAEGTDVMPGGARQLLAYRSPPLSTLAGTLMKWSQNLYAETLLETLGGLSCVRDIVGSWGVEPGSVILRDGSGLSRYDYSSPEAIVTILAHVDRDERLRGPFKAALPIAGRDGTLERRMAGTPAAGITQAKTGSIANVRALSGYTVTADGERLVFSIIANNFEIPASTVEQTSDAIVGRLARFSRRG